MQATLILSERAALARLERIVQKGLEYLLDMGKALLEIREDRLYRAEFRTWEDYCQQRWGMTRRHAERLLKGAQIIHDLKARLEPGTPLPGNERLARALSLLSPDDRAKAWAEALEDSANGEPTSPEVDTIVARMLGRQRSRAAPYANGVAGPKAPPEPAPGSGLDLLRRAREAFAQARPEPTHLLAVLDQAYELAARLPSK